MTNVTINQSPGRSVAFGHGRSTSIRHPFSSVSQWAGDDFSYYSSSAHFIADPKGLYSVGEDQLSNYMFIDSASGLNAFGFNLSQSLRYDFHDRATMFGPSDDIYVGSGRCHDYTIQRNLIFPGNVHVVEIWQEFYIKFSNGFRSDVSTSLGTGSNGLPVCSGSNPDYKTWFVRTLPDNRFEVKTGQGGRLSNGNYYWDCAAPEIDNHNPDVDFTGSNPYDGNWHQVRLHAKISTTTSSFDGLYIVNIDGARAYTSQSINTSNNLQTDPLTAIYGAKLGANLNQGPVLQSQSVYWGKWSVYNQDPGWGI